MRAIALLLCGLVTCARAQPPGDLLRRVTRKVMDAIDSLPKYMCTETIERLQYEPASSRTHEPCEPDPHQRTRLMTSDRLRLDVAVSAAREMYSWVGESRFEDRSLFDLVGGGALSTGSFSSFLMVVFRTDNTAFSYRGPVTEGGRRLEAYEYRVPKAVSHYVYVGSGRHVTTGYFGAIFVDPQTADLVRLEVHTEGLPPETGSCQSSSTLAYTRVRLNDTDFLLPGRSELTLSEANGAELKNTTAFSNCHEFLGESKLHFDSTPEPGATPAALAALGGELPAGLPLKITFTHAINPATAAAGDKIQARVIDPVRDEKQQILVPKGATVTLRILEIRRFFQPMPVVRLVLKPETLEIAGTSRPLAAQPDLEPPSPSPVRKTALQRRNDPIVHVLLASQDSRAGQIQFSNIGTNFEIPSGFESKWITAAPKH